MKNVRSVSVLVALLAGVAAGPAPASEEASSLRVPIGSALDVIGLTADQRLVRFRESLPQRARTIGRVIGLSGDTRLVGIDFRPATGELYGLGDNGGVYTVSPDTAVATFKAQLSVVLSGSSFGVDFNPTVDRLRIVSDNGQNLRANVADGVTATDLALNYAGTTALGVTGVAYTNNDLDANTATTLFDIDTTLDQVVVQAPPNNGTLNPAGKLLVDVGSAVGVDIYSRLDQGRTVGNTAFASLTVGGRAGFFALNILTGEATLRGWFRVGDQVMDIAIPINQP
jgi:hypothetical protein